MRAKREAIQGRASNLGAFLRARNLFWLRPVLLDCFPLRLWLAVAMTEGGDQPECVLNRLNLLRLRDELQTVRSIEIRRGRFEHEAVWIPKIGVGDEEAAR